MTRLAYRPVLFEPSPFTGERFALGALLSQGGAIKFIENPTPGLECRSATLASVARIVITDFLAAQSLDWEHPPPSAGPCVLLGEVQLLPRGMEDPEKWLRGLFVVAQRGEQRK